MLRLIIHRNFVEIPIYLRAYSSAQKSKYEVKTSKWKKRDKWEHTQKSKQGNLFHLDNNISITSIIPSIMR
jgi:hypothetical protein